MKGTWVYVEKLDNWHLVIKERDVIYALAGEDPVLEYETWCGHVLDGKAPRKPGSQMSGWADIVHDECYRKSEE